MTRGRIPIITDYALTDLVHLKVDPYGGAPSSQATPASNFFKRGDELQGLPYNVKNYGATGDGVTDDAAAIQDTIDAANTAGGGSVFVPPGDYLIGVTIDMAANVHLQGAGLNSVITLDFDEKGIRASGIDDVIVSHLKIVGGANIADTAQSGIQFLDVTNGLVFSVFVQDMGYDGIQFLGDDVGCRAIGCHVDNCQDDGVNVGGWNAHPTVDSIIVGNYITGCVSDGIHVSDASAYTTVSGNTVEGCGAGIGFFEATFITVCDNTIRGCTDASILTHTTGCNDIIVANNVCDGAVNGIQITNNAARWLIQSNTITNCSDDGISIATATDINILGNQFEGVVDRNIAILGGDHYIIANNKIIGGNRGMNIGVAASMNISGNYIKGAVTHGIVMSIGGPAATEVAISNNLIVDGCTSAGITIFGFTNVLVEGNYIVGIAGANAIEETGTSASNTIINNKIGTGVISPDATSVVRGNVGFVTENGGTSAAIATGATIAHGCALTPTIVQVNAAEAVPTDITISVDAANITVNFGGGGNRTFFWYARYSP